MPVRLAIAMQQTVWVCQVFAGPLFLVKTKFHIYKKQVISKSIRVILDFSACYSMSQYIEKAYGEVENNQLSTHAKFMLCKLYYYAESK